MNALSGGEIAAILTALGAIIVAVGGTVVNIIVALRKIESVVSTTAAKVESVEAKTEVIKASVDGAASKQVAKIEALTETVDTLKSVIADQKDTAKGLAVAASEATGAQAALDSIEKHTERTATNTASLAEKTK